MADNRSDAELRKNVIENFVSELRAKIIKDLDDSEAQYYEEIKPCHDEYIMLQAISHCEYGMPNLLLKEAFAVMVESHKMHIKATRDATMAALDAMEKDMFEDLEKLEEHLRQEQRKPSWIPKTYRFEDYYRGPTL